MSKKIRKFKKKIKHPISLIKVGDHVAPVDPRLKDKNIGIIIAVKENGLIRTKDKYQIFWVNSSELTWEVHSDLLINFEFFNFITDKDEE